MRRDSKYYALYAYLRRCEKDDVTLTFAQIEKMVRRRLPSSARTSRAWWSNRSSKNKIIQSTAWLQAGYRMKSVDLANEQVTFHKPNTQLRPEWEGDTLIWNGELIKALRHHMNLSQDKMAKKLGVRQQKVSEWETGAYLPKPSTCKNLTFMAKKVGFRYT